MEEKITKGDKMKTKMMLVLMLLVSFGLFSPSVHATDLSNVEIFDVKREKVIKIVPNTEGIQVEVRKCLKKINNITKRLNPIPTDGQIIKIPVQPSIMINNQWMNSLVDEVKIILPTNDKPLFMIFDDENKPYFFETEYDLTNLLSQIEK